MAVVKYGMQNGHQRWHCTACLHTFINRRKPSYAAVHKLYYACNMTLSQIAERFAVSAKTISRILSKQKHVQCPVIRPRPVVVLTDTTYRGWNFGILIMLDNLDGTVLWYKFLEHKESMSDYMEGIAYLEEHGYDILCIVSDGVSGIRTHLPQYKHQLCQFHQIMTIRTRLTRRPKDIAGQELLSLTQQITHLSRTEFTHALEEWYQQWKCFVNECITSPKSKKKSYPNRVLRNAYRSLKRNVKYLFIYEEFDKGVVPNTNNRVESLNGKIKKALNAHAGLNAKHREELIIDILMRQTANK